MMVVAVVEGEGKRGVVSFGELFLVYKRPQQRVFIDRRAVPAIATMPQAQL
jgi:hypothetical protein